VWSSAATTAAEQVDVPATPVVQQTAQGESFVQFGPDLTLKLFRNIEPGIHPDLELRRYLTERTSFDKLAPVFGAIEYHSGDTFSLGLMQQNLDPEQTAWTLFRDHCTAYLDEVAGTTPPTVDTKQSWMEQHKPRTTTQALSSALTHAAGLGMTTADLHRALSTYTEEPDLRPDPVNLLYQRSLYQSMRAEVRQELATIRRLSLTAPPEVQDGLAELLECEPAMLDEINRIRNVPASGQRIRLHGNYRLDELRLIEDEFYVLDLSGDHTRAMSERRLKAPPLRDVAEMLRSLDYVSLVAAQNHPSPDAAEHAEYWYRRLGEMFVASYLEASEGSPALPTEPEGIDAALAAFELTKALREVHWELLNRVDWIPIALQGALRNIQ